MIRTLCTHLLHADLEPGVAVALGRVGDLEVEVGVGEVRLVLAEVVGHAAGPGDRPGAAEADGVVLGQDADAPDPVEEDPVAEEQLLHVGEDLGEARRGPCRIRPITLSLKS